MGQNKSKEQVTNQVKKALKDWWHQVQAKPILYALIFFFVMSVLSLDNILGTLQQTNINIRGAIWFGSLLLLSWLVLLRTAKQPRPVQVITAGVVSLLVLVCLIESIQYITSHSDSKPIKEIWKTNGFWTLAALLISSPVAFVVWRFRDENQSKDINLKEFQKISEWVTGAHFPDAEKIKVTGKQKRGESDATTQWQNDELGIEFNMPAKSKQALHTFSKRDGAVGLQIAAVYNLLPFYRGDYGQAFEKPSVHLLHSAWQVLQHDILQELDNADDDKTRKDLIKQLHQRADSPLGQAITRVLLACDYANKPLLHRHPEILRGICLSGMNFNLAGLEHGTLCKKMFCRQDLTGAQWQGIRMKTIQVKKIKNKEKFVWNLAGIELKQADLLGVEFEKVNLSSSKLDGVNLSGSKLERVNLSNSELNEADLSGSKLERVILSNAKLGDANLSNAELNRVNLFNSFIGKVKFNNATLKWSNLCKANTSWDLSDVELTGARFLGVNLLGITFDAQYYSDTGSFQGNKSDEFCDVYDNNMRNLNEIIGNNIVQGFGESKKYIPPLLKVKSLEGSLICDKEFSRCKKSEQQLRLRSIGLIILYNGDDSVSEVLSCQRKKQDDGELIVSKYSADSIPFKIDLEKTRENNPDWEISIK